MSAYSRPRRRFEDKQEYKSQANRSDTRGSHQKPAGSQKSFGGRRPQSGRTGRPLPTFDPSLFIQKVEEKTAPLVYVPKNTFSDFSLEAQLLENILKKGYIAPTPIQDQAIPLLLQGKDIIATANTGTGKTAAFLLPLINNVLLKKTDRVLIIAPTRELADQIYSELKIFTENMGLSSVLCIGGSNMYAQIRALKNNPAFVLGTPGRLIDLEKNNILNFHKYTSIVLDEVDRMLDMGFINDIKYIIHKLPTKRHSLFFSATLPKTLQSIMSGFLHNPISICVKTRQSAANVNQDVIHVRGGNKIEMLHDLLIKPEVKKSIIFVRTKRAADKLGKALVARGFTVSVIHGDKSQPQRNKALALFKSGKVNCLLATDVVARGIDIDDVSHVINFDVPQTHEDYIHRIGRTGRADKIGQAITFID